MTYKEYINMMIQMKASKPYMNEIKFNEAFGIQEKKIPVFVASKKTKTMEPKLRNCND